MLKLTEQQIKQKLQEGRNYKRLYLELKVKYDELKLENKQLKQQLLEQRAYFEAIIENQNARIVELETIVFGRKNRFRSSSDTKTPKQPRDTTSYRRDKPTEDEITFKEHHPINTCHHCHGPLTNKEEYTRYIEDIILAALNTTTQFKTVEEHTIEREYCIPCGKYSSAQDLRGQETTIGPMVRTLVCYLVTLRDHSYGQVINILKEIYSFKITDGEITNILDSRRLELLPEYEKLKDSIRAGPAVHMDESRWKIQSEKAGYAWSMSSTTSSDVVFKLADSRGMGNAEELLGENYQGIGITDRYPGYKHLFELHQICWAHLQRTAKDLTHLECLSKTKQKHVIKFYQNLDVVYATIREYQNDPFDKVVRSSS